MFTVDLLQEWKGGAQDWSWHRVISHDYADEGIAPKLGEDELCALFRTSAANDLELFRRSDTWPATPISRTLRVDGVDEQISTTGVAEALATLDDLIFVAEPGMGKTTTVFQIAEAVLENGYGSPIIVPLGDWSVDGSPLLESILNRSSFGEITEDHFRRVAANPEVIFLMDGWNELDGESRRRATVELQRLEMELPNLSLLVATRKQALDVPIDGTRVALSPLSETEQLEIAWALRGDAGERLLDEAWRTTGVRELVTIPLYLTALLALPDGRPFPTTKEEILRRFVEVHEEDYQKAEALREVASGLHERYLAALGARATSAANTTIVEVTARSSISDTGENLVVEGQIAAKPEPRTVLEALVNHHVLIQVGEPPGYSFQHQQFQEWYASQFVEQLMYRSVDDEKYHEELRTEILDQRAWEEPILFACERLARGDDVQQEACSVAIVAALGVDPILAAEMIYRSTDAVWQRVRRTVEDFIERWHVPGKVDRAVHFMVTSGRPDFLACVWPLMTHEDDQVHLAALRAGRRFRPSLLGNDGAERIAALGTELRRRVLDEIVSNSGTGGLDLAVAVAKADPATEVKASVVEALAFRRADRLVVEVLQDAEDAVFDRLAKRSLIDHITEGSIEAQLTAARERSQAQGIAPYDRIYSLLYGPEGDDTEAELARAIAETEIEERNGGVASLIHQAKERFPRGVAEGILGRVREGRELPVQAAELMAGAGFAFEDEALVDIALVEDHHDSCADAAASALGPHAVGRLIDRMLELAEEVLDGDGKYDEEAANRHRAIRDRIRMSHASHLLAAIEMRSDEADNQRISKFADLICRHGDGTHRRGQPFDIAQKATIMDLVEDWENRLLASAESTREQLASIATLASHAPSVNLLPVLQRLLDEELGRWRAYTEQARAESYRGGTATNEARTLWTWQYRRAFQAIHCPETASLMERYLLDHEFGRLAASVLAGHWRAANEPSDDRWWTRSPDFSGIGEKRDTRIRQPDVSSPEADAIFSAVEQLITEDSSDDAKKHALALGTVAAALPHGEQGNLVNALIQTADWRTRGPLLTNLTLSGEIIDVALVRQGINELFEAAETHPWILGEGSELQNLLMLLPLTTRPCDTVDIFAALPEQHRTLDALEAVIEVLEHAPGDEAQNVLFRLAEIEPRLYARRTWRDAVCGRGAQSAAQRLVDLIADGVLDRHDHGDMGDMSRRLASLMDQHPRLRRHIYRAIEREPAPPGWPVLAQAVAEKPDEDGFVLLIQLEIKHKRAFASWITIERAVTEQVPSETWKGSYHVVPIPAVGLRRKLMTMTTDGGPNDIAARYLIQIDMMRDDYGVPESEPRHPDIASGKAWPIIGSRSDACGTG